MSSVNKKSERTTQPCVTVRELTKVYSTDLIDTYALNCVDMDIAYGEFVAVVGPSGCGKTTLLSILGLLDVPTSGEYILDGSRVGGESIRQRQYIRNEKIGIVFQAFHLIRDLTVQQNVELPLLFRRVPAAERARRALAVLERVDMLPRAQHFPRQLSGGQQQRVAVARAVVGEPSLVLADEPTGNLDSANADMVMALLLDIHTAGTTVVMVTHNTLYASKAERVVQLSDGAVVLENRRSV